LLFNCERQWIDQDGTIRLSDSVSSSERNHHTFLRWSPFDNEKYYGRSSRRDSFHRSNLPFRPEEAEELNRFHGIRIDYRKEKVGVNFSLDLLKSASIFFFHAQRSNRINAILSNVETFHDSYKHAFNSEITKQRVESHGIKVKRTELLIQMKYTRWLIVPVGDERFINKINSLIPFYQILYGGIYHRI